MAKENRQQLRQLIAQQAARLMAQDGIADFAYAKKKAGRLLAVDEDSVLPSNAEIEVELKHYHALFLGDVQPKILRELRQNALLTMQLLAQFSPYLTGAVLDGTAGRQAETNIHLFADNLKEVELFLLNKQIPYSTNEKPARTMYDAKRDKKADGRKRVPVFTLETDTGLIKLSVLAVDDIRVVNKRAADGSRAARLDTNGVIELLAQDFKQAS
jgi:hypothetical protein